MASLGMSLIPALGLSYQQCPAPGFNVGGGIGNLPFSSVGGVSTGAIALFLSSSMMPTNGMIDNISVAPSTSWYFALTPFESIMLGLIILKLFLLRYLTILPISLNDLSNKEFFNFGRRKKRELENPKLAKEKERLAETMFTVIRRLDMQDCLLRTLCELQAHSLRGYQVPREVKLTLSALSKSGWKREHEKKPVLNKDVIEERPILSVFEEAVKIGWDAKSGNVTECMERYFICPLTTDDIFSHFDTVKVVNVL